MLMSKLMIAILCVTTLAETVGACDPRACPRLPCNEPVKLPGQCCPSCPCEYDGQYYNIGDLVFTDDPCVTCECSKYGIDCLQYPCLKADCPNPIKVDYSCCPVCGCLVGDTVYDLGYQVYSSKPCEECRCEYNGKVACTRKSCPAMDCPNPIRINGVCCRQCGCKGRGGVIHEFGPIENGEQCKHCTCNLNGTITCEKPECPKVKCDGRRMYISEGECCPKCRCLFKSAVYNPGEVMPINVQDPCVEVCHCGADGLEFCNFTSCPKPACEQPVFIPGQCCPQCGCLGKGKTFIEFGPIFDDLCQECECAKDGTIKCGRKQACPKVTCVNGLYRPKADEPKECCQKCRCKFGGEFYKPGEKFEGPRCQECECRAFTGRVYCEKANCSSVQLQCANPTFVEGDCCPSCPDGPSCTYKRTTIEYGSYKTLGRQVCTCMGDPWFPNAFCAPVVVGKALVKKNSQIWTHYGYPAMKEPRSKRGQ